MSPTRAGCNVLWRGAWAHREAVLVKRRLHAARHKKVVEVAEEGRLSDQVDQLEEVVLDRLPVECAGAELVRAAHDDVAALLVFGREFRTVLGIGRVDDAVMRGELDVRDALLVDGEAGVADQRLQVADALVHVADVGEVAHLVQVNDHVVRHQPVEAAPHVLLRLRGAEVLGTADHGVQQPWAALVVAVDQRLATALSTDEAEHVRLDAWELEDLSEPVELVVVKHLRAGKRNVW